MRAAAIVPNCIRGVARQVGTGLLKYPNTWRALDPPHDGVLQASVESTALRDERSGREEKFQNPDARIGRTSEWDHSQYWLLISTFLAG